MKYVKHFVGDEVRFCRVKRRGPKNSRVIWLETGEDYLVPSPELEEVSPEEAGVENDPEAVELPPLPEKSLTGEEVCRLMTGNQVTIKELAKRLDVTADQVRQARRDGIEGILLVHEWEQAITSTAESFDVQEEIAA